MFRVKRTFSVSAFTLLFSNIILMVTDERVLTGILILSVTLCIAFVLKKMHFAKHMLIIMFCIVLSLFLFGINDFVSDYTLSVCGTDKTVSGTVSSSASASDSIVLSDNTVDGKEIFGKIKVYTKRASEFSPGDSITFTVTELIPTVSDGIFRFHSLSDRTFLTAFPDDNSFVTDSSSDSLYNRILSIKATLNNKYFSNLDSPNAGVVSALISGDKDHFSPELINDLKYSGASHIFAVSGMHLSLWTSLFFIFFKRRAKSKFLPNIAAIVFIIFYCIFTGFSPSVLRAGIMLAAVFTAKIIKRHSDPLNSLGLAGTLLLLFNPFLAGNVSFLLSFISTFALIFFSEYILPSEVYKSNSHIFINRRINSIISSLLISLSVTLTTLPITALFFGYVSLMSPVSSLIITPLAEAVMITGGLIAVFPSGNFVSDILFRITQIFSDAIILVCARFGEFDIAIQPSPVKLILPWFILSLLATVAVFLRYKNRKKTLSCILACLLTLISITAIINTISRDVTEIYIPSNGNGTLISVVRSSAHKSAVFGTGGLISSASETVYYLNSRGILKTDNLIIPRDTITENNNTEYLTDNLQPRRIIKLYKNTNIAKSSCELWKNAAVSSEISSDFAVSILKIDDIKIVICTLPTSDFSAADSIYTSGDILITRNAVPESLDTDNFETVIIMTDRENLPLTENSYSTAHNDIRLVLKGDSYALY